MNSITPKILQNGEWFKLKERPLWVCPNGFAAVTYKGRIRRIRDDFSVLLDSKNTFDKDQCSFYKGPIEQLKFLNEHENQDPFSKALELQNQRTIKRKLHNNLLAVLANLGIDRAVHNLIKQESRAAQNILKTAINFRPRFKNILALENETITAQSQLLMILDKEFLELPFKYFTAPIGKGDFSRLPSKLDRSITNSDVLKIINSSEDPPDLLKVRNFKDQAIASLIFHNEILRNYNNTNLERDVSNALIEDGCITNFIYDKQEKIKKIFNENQKLLDSNDLKLAVRRCSNRSKVRLSGWQESTFEAFYTLATRMPRHLKLSKKQVDLTNPEYPLIVKKLSIFTLLSTTESKFLQKKYIHLHECGIKNISDLILMHSDLFRLFFRK